MTPVISALVMTEDADLNFEQAADAGGAHFQHGSELLVRKDRFLTGTLNLHEFQLVRHDQIQVHGGDLVFLVVEVQERFSLH